VAANGATYPHFFGPAYYEDGNEFLLVYDIAVEKHDPNVDQSQGDPSSDEPQANVETGIHERQMYLNSVKAALVPRHRCAAAAPEGVPSLELLV
jgi:hypothetical protein